MVRRYNVEVGSKTSRFWATKKKNQKAPPGRGPSTAEATPCRVGRDEQSEARTGNSTPRGGPHRDQTRLRLKTWSKGQFSRADSTPQQFCIYCRFINKRMLCPICLTGHSAARTPWRDFEFADRHVRGGRGLGLSLIHI